MGESFSKEVNKLNTKTHFSQFKNKQEVNVSEMLNATYVTKFKIEIKFLLLWWSSASWRFEKYPYVIEKRSYGVKKLGSIS